MKIRRREIRTAESVVARLNEAKTLLEAIKTGDMVDADLSRMVLEMQKGIAKAKEKAGLA